MNSAILWDDWFKKNDIKIVEYSYILRMRNFRLQSGKMTKLNLKAFSC